MRCHGGEYVILIQPELHRVYDEPFHIAAEKLGSVLPPPHLKLGHNTPNRWSGNEDTIRHQRANHLLGSVRIDLQFLAEDPQGGKLRARPELTRDHGLLDRKQNLLCDRQAEFQVNRKREHPALVALVQLGWQAYSDFGSASCRHRVNLPHPVAVGGEQHLALIGREDRVRV